MTQIRLWDAEDVQGTKFLTLTTATVSQMLPKWVVKSSNLMENALSVTTVRTTMLVNTVPLKGVYVPQELMERERLPERLPEQLPEQQPEQLPELPPELPPEQLLEQLLETQLDQQIATTTIQEPRRMEQRVLQLLMTIPKILAQSVQAQVTLLKPL